MRWEDERYVRLYTRDTTDWLALSFEAQALFALLLRKVDRAGILRLGRHGKRGVAIAIGHPGRWEALAQPFEELLDDGCIILSGDYLLVPNFVEAQEANASDKARQQKSRELARDMLAAQRLVTERDEPSQSVTKSHTRSHAVTSGHTPSHAVTPSRAVPCRAEPEESKPVAGADAPPRAPRTPSAAEQLFARIQDEADKADPKRVREELGPKTLNGMLKKPLDEVGKVGLEKCIPEFLRDDFAKERGYPLKIFLSKWREYHRKAQDAPPQPIDLRSKFPDQSVAKLRPWSDHG